MCARVCVCVCEHAYQSSGQLFLWKEARREASGQVAPAAARRGVVMPRLALQEQEEGAVCVQLRL